MKTLSRDAMIRRALAEGVSVQIDGRTVNAAGAKLAPVRIEPSKPEPPAIEPRESIEKARIEGMLAEALARKEPGRPVRWVFHMKRDRNNLLERIEAIAYFN